MSLRFRCRVYSNFYYFFYFFCGSFLSFFIHSFFPFLFFICSIGLWSVGNYFGATGTGKTLSIICSALQWVIDQRKQAKCEKIGESIKNWANDGHHGSDDEPDWMRDFVGNKDEQCQEKNIKMKKFGVGHGKPVNRRNQGSCRDLFSRGMKEEDLIPREECKNWQKKNDALQLSDEEFLLEAYESEAEGAGGTSKRKAGVGSHISSSDEEEEADQSDDDEVEEKLKVYFCSRTHSQLSQFTKELRKTVFAKEMKVVCLGSRKNFCINEGLVNYYCLSLFSF